MANKRIFQNKKLLPSATTTNLAGGTAYAVSDKNALARLCATGTLGNTFYSTAESDLTKVLDLCGRVPLSFVGQLAVYCRQKGLLKDIPALLLAYFVVNSSEFTFEETQSVFNAVVSNGKMLKNFVQIVRSGQLGRKSLGTRASRLVNDWLNAREPESLFKDNIGNDPSLRDVLMLSHPKGKNASQNAMFKYIMDGTYNKLLPPTVRSYEKWKAGEIEFTPEIPFEYLTNRPLSADEWSEVLQTCSWQVLRMNLNTFQRHGVFNNNINLKIAASRLADPSELPKFVYPYQIYTSSKFAEVAPAIQDGLGQALENSLVNVKAFSQDVTILTDISGSMAHPVTGSRGTVNTKIRCVDVAALISSIVLSKNPSTKCIAFNDGVALANINKNRTIVENTHSLAAMLSGGTNTGNALAHLNRILDRSPVVLIVSDNQSWITKKNFDHFHSATPALAEWEKYRRRVKNAKLICLDLQPEASAQVPEREDVLHIGGWSESVFEVIRDFIEGGTASFVDEIEKVELF